MFVFTLPRINWFVTISVVLFGSCIALIVVSSMFGDGVVFVVSSFAIPEMIVSMLGIVISMFDCVADVFRRVWRNSCGYVFVDCSFAIPESDFWFGCMVVVFRRVWRNSCGYVFVDCSFAIPESDFWFGCMAVVFRRM